MKKGFIDLLLMPVIFGLLIMGVGLFGLGQSPAVDPTQTITDGNADTFQTDIGYNSMVCATFKPASGEPYSLGCQKNTVTDTGFNLIRDYLDGGVQAVGINFTVIGNTTAPTTGSTSHPGEIGVCGLGGKFVDTIRHDSAGNRTVSTTFTFTCSGAGTLIANSTGLYNWSSGTYFAGVSFNDATFSTNGDQLELNWTQEFDEP